MSAKIKRFVCNPLQENCYVVSNDGRCVIIDPGFDHIGIASGKPSAGVCSAERFCEAEKLPAEGAGSGLYDLYGYLDAEGLRPDAILLTHTHPDHTFGVPAIAERFGIPVYPSMADNGPIPYPQQEDSAGVYSAERFCEAEKLPAESCAGLTINVIRTPGHTPDSICFYIEADAILFTGDTLFAGTIGRTDLPGGNYDDEIRSIMEKLIWLPGGTTIYPGHGPASTIARERMSNPFLEPFNEPDDPALEV